MSWIRPLALSVMLVTAPALSHAGDLTTRDVVELSRSGLGDEVLVALVEVDGGPFDLSPADLLDLKAEGLSDRVLAALVRAGRHRVAADELQRLDPDADDSIYGFSTDHHSFRDLSTDQHVTRVVGVPVPVYVPVYTDKPRSSRRHHRERVSDPEPATTSPSVRRGPVTANSIRYAPPGFHPGTVRSRVESAPTSSADSRSPAPSTPGIARSSTGTERPRTPGVARSQRSPEK